MPTISSVEKTRSRRLLRAYSAIGSRKFAIKCHPAGPSRAPFEMVIWPYYEVSCLWNGPVKLLG